MDGKKRADAAVEYKHNKYNCCQAVLMAYSDVLNIDKDLLAKIGSGFGSGMGTMEATCGALCGASFVAGILNDSDKKTTMITREILTNFKSRCGAISCKDLKGIETGNMLCSCDDCVKNAVLSIEETFVKQEV